MYASYRNSSCNKAIENSSMTKDETEFTWCKHQAKNEDIGEPIWPWDMINLWDGFFPTSYLHFNIFNVYIYKYIYFKYRNSIKISERRFADI